MIDGRPARWYGRLLRLAPRRLRDRHGAEMTQWFLAELEAARARGRLAVPVVWARALVDVLAGSRRFAPRADVGAVGEVPRQAIVEPLWRDVRLALRGYRRRPLMPSVVIATLALAIGATSAVFAAVNAVVFRPLPFPHSDRLIKVSQQREGVARALSLSPPNFFDVMAAARTCEGFVAYGSGTVTLLAPGGLPERIRTTFTTAGLSDVIGVPPALGRLFSESDDQPGAPRVLVLSHEVWLRRFGGDPMVPGRAVTVDGAPATIVGVMPEGFSFPGGADVTDVWMPMRLSHTTPANPAIPPEKYRGYRVLSVVARLRSGVPIARAEAELGRIGGDLSRQYPDANRAMTIVAEPLKTAMVAGVRQGMFLFLGAVVCLLFVACANVATLFAVRTASRHHDLALRLALGCGRAGIVRLLVVESLVLALAGGVAGLGAASGLLRLLVVFAPAGIPGLREARLDAATVAVTIALAVVCGLLSSLAPLWQTARGGPALTLKAGARSGDAQSHQRLRHALTFAEVALSMTLLTTAGLLARTAHALGNVERGFDETGTYRVDRLELPARTSTAASAIFYDRLARALAATPGVTAAGETLAVPLDPRGRFYVDDTPFAIDGRARVEGDRPEARIQVVSGGFFQSLRIPLVAGRAFDEHDGPGSQPVVMINQALAARYFPNGDAIGRWLTHDLSIVPAQPNHRQIVGVVANVRQFNLDDPYEPQLFVPHTQMPWPAMALVIRSPWSADRVETLVRTAVGDIDPTLPVPPVVPVADAIRDALGQPALRALLLAGFATTALALAALGLYGVMSFGVEQRRRELAIRLMLGATTGRTRALILRDGLLVTIGGAATGLILSWWVSGSLSSLLFGVRPYDPLTIAAVSGLVLATTVSAGYLATRHVSTIAPMHET